jgi:hypothetical protein
MVEVINLATRKRFAVPNERPTMAKRHHDSKGAHNFRPEHNEHYAGMESRRAEEMRDAGMIQENRSAIANLPQEVMIKPYPKAGYALPEGLDDTIRGVDSQMDYDDSKRRAHFEPKKV